MCTHHGVSEGFHLLLAVGAEGGHALVLSKLVEENDRSDRSFGNDCLPRRRGEHDHLERLVRRIIERNLDLATVVTAQDYFHSCYRQLAKRDFLSSERHRETSTKEKGRVTKQVPIIVYFSAIVNSAYVG